MPAPSNSTARGFPAMGHHRPPLTWPLIPVDEHRLMVQDKHKRHTEVCQTTSLPTGNSSSNQVMLHFDPPFLIGKHLQHLKTCTTRLPLRPPYNRPSPLRSSNAVGHCQGEVGFSLGPTRPEGSGDRHAWEGDPCCKTYRSIFQLYKQICLLVCKTSQGRQKIWHSWKI